MASEVTKNMLNILKGIKRESCMYACSAWELAKYSEALVPPYMTLKRLQSRGLVLKIDDKGKPMYMLTPKGERLLNE